MKVDIGEIDSTLKVIDAYRNNYNELIKKENQVINEMANTWEGDDYWTFYSKWEASVKDNKAPDKLFKEELDEYYNYLDNAKGLYEEMQKKLRKMAGRLPIS